MPLKPNVSKISDRRSTITSPSRLVNNPDKIEEGGEETEIAAQISVPQDGGWGWVVVVASFFAVLILDGIAFTYGSLLKDIGSDLKISDSLASLVNSITVAVYFLASPLATALINRFGFRACAMSGSVIGSFALLASYFATNPTALCFFYGVMGGFGFCLVNLTAGIIVGFYFEKLRPIALAITLCGSSVGVMSMFPLNLYLVSISGWRTTTLLHAGLFAFIFFLAMTFRPLLSFTVVKTSDPTSRTVTYLPNVSTAAIKPSTSKSKDVLKSKVAERLFGAVSNAAFPTAAAVVEDTPTASGLAGPSVTARSRLTLTAHNPQGGISHRQLKQAKSIISRTSVGDKAKKSIEINCPEVPERKKGCCPRMCQWEEHVEESRPMYRDDIFYEGNLEKLPAYQKSMMDTTGEKTGLEYQLAVSRAITVNDLKEKRGVCTTAARRVLATMLDPSLLKKPSFMFICLSGFLTYLGYLVPYVYLQDRNLNEGVAVEHCKLFVSVIGLSNAIGRLILGFMAIKFDPLCMFIMLLLVAGLSTVASSFSYSVYYQYGYCCVFGFSIACLACLKSMSIVNLYGLEKLTNAYGIMLLFQGIASLISTPLAGILKNNFGYAVSFYVSGSFMTAGGLSLIPVPFLAKREEKKSQQPKTPGSK